MRDQMDDKLENIVAADEVFLNLDRITSVDARTSDKGRTTFDRHDRDQLRNSTIKQISHAADDSALFFQLVQIDQFGLIAHNAHNISAVLI